MSLIPENMSVQKIVPLQAPGPDTPRVVEGEEEEGSGTVLQDTVLLELEELGEEVPEVLQRLKERVRHVQARMKELRLTERDVVKAAQRMATSQSGGSGQTPHTSIESDPSCPTEVQTKPITQAPKLTLSRSHSLPDKKQLTLVAMTQCPAPEPAPVPSLSTTTQQQHSSPPHQTFSLDKVHLLAFWRCALPLRRMNEILNVLEAVFTKREAQAAKAALALASRRKASPRTTTNTRHTQAMLCTATTPWGQGCSSGHTPATPHSTGSLPTSPQSSSGCSSSLNQDSTPSGVSHPSTPQSSVSHQPAALCSESGQDRTPQTEPQHPSTPVTDSRHSSTCSDSWHHSSPGSSLHQPGTPCSGSCPHTPQEQSASQSLLHTKKVTESRQLHRPASAKGFGEELSPPTTRSRVSPMEVSTVWVTNRQLVP